MTDKLTKEARSRTMQAIKSKDSKMELSLRGELSKKGLRYRKNVSRLPGKPDIAFIGKKIVLFLDSCFWHGCKRHCRIPSSNVDYWNKKITRNRERDKLVNKKYKLMGWHVLRFWECDFKRSPEVVVKKIFSALS